MLGWDKGSQDWQLESGSGRSDDFIFMTFPFYFRARLAVDELVRAHLHLLWAGMNRLPIPLRKGRRPVQHLVLVVVKDS